MDRFTKKLIEYGNLINISKASVLHKDIFLRQNLTHTRWKKLKEMLKLMSEKIIFSVM